MADQGFFGNLVSSLQSPLFLGGVGLLSGGGYQGLNAGIHQGLLGQKQKSDEAYRMAELQRHQQMEAENIRRFNAQDGRAAALHPLELMSKQAQINLQNAHAKYYLQAGDAKNSQAGDYKTGNSVNALDDYGLDASGQMIHLGQVPKNGLLSQSGVRSPHAVTDSSVLGESTTTPGSTSSSETPGPVGRLNTSVPGIVIDKRGKTDIYATKAATANSVLDETPDVMRARLVDHQKTQQFWSFLNGKAPIGTLYEKNGSLRNIKEEAKKDAKYNDFQAIIDDVKDATDILLGVPDANGVRRGGSNMLTRGVSVATNGAVSPELYESRETLKHAVTALGTLARGANHADRVDQRNLSFFAPSVTDTGEIIGFKADQLHRMMTAYIGAPANRGEVFKSAMSEGVQALRDKYGQGPVERKQRKPILDDQTPLGEAPRATQPNALKSGKYRFDPTTNTMVPQ